MNLKKKLKAFFTLKRRQNGGFTLVELIVVIAILAILAGVGTAGYAGYIKNANKNADKVLVGNVMRAIETGNNSTAFKLSSVLQVSEQGAQIPIGFVVLTENGMTTMESNSTQALVGTQAPCKIGDLVLYTSTAAGTDKYKEGLIIKKDKSITAYTIASETISNCCLTHSQYSSEKINVWNSGKNASNQSNNDRESTENTYAMKAGATIAEAGPEHVDGQFKQGEVFGSYYEATLDAQGKYTTANNQGAITDAVKAAYGDSDMKLKYDGWSVDGIPTFWKNATQIWGKVESLSNMMQTAVDTNILGLNLGDIMGITNHGSSAKTVYDVAVAVGECYKGADGTPFGGKNAFVARWGTYGNATEKGELYNGDDFGMTGYTGREYYSAMRGAYNNCFASYVRAHHSAANCTAHADAMAKYGERGDVLLENKLAEKNLNIPIPSWLLGDMANENFPRQICKDSFTTTNAVAQGYMGVAWGCTECADLYDQYVKSGADKADAAAAFETFQTAAASDPTIVDGGLFDAQGNQIDFFDYYNQYLTEFQGLYTAASNMAAGDESCIVISVFYQDGQMHCQVVPDEANPVKD